jgi:hypothetical protein
MIVMANAVKQSNRLCEEFTTKPSRKTMLDRHGYSLAMTKNGCAMTKRGIVRTEKGRAMTEKGLAMTVLVQ